MGQSYIPDVVFTAVNTGRAIKSDKVLEIRHHAEAAVPGGAMGRSRFIRAFNDLGVDDDRTVDHFFDCHDKDENGRVPFENFLASVAIVGKPMSQAHSKLNFSNFTKIIQYPKGA
eukprot:933159-Amorphochlora_amoeboformis.AAC.1